MKILIGPILLSLTLLADCGMAAHPDDVLVLQSASYRDFRQLITGEAPSSSTTVSATLRFPEERRDSYPAVMIVHTIGGYQEANEGWYSTEFRKAGYATLTYDSFAARGLRERDINSSRDGPPMASGVADAFAALRALAHHPKIDARRIAIVGFSFGGEIAHLTAFSRLRSLLADGYEFAAHVAYYPAGVYGVVAAPSMYTGAPVLMLLGGKDDNLPLEKVEGYLKYARDAGNPAPIETVVYPYAYHAWTVSALGEPRFYPQYGSTKKCPLILFGQSGPRLLENDRTLPFDPKAIEDCRGQGRGYSMGYDATIRAKALEDALQFLKRHLAS